jgi:uncharacterized protein YkwD
MPLNLARLLPAIAGVLLAAAAPASRDRPLRLKAPDLASKGVEVYPEPAEPRDAVKRIVFERINRDRAAAGRAPVVWDEAASRVADAFCAQQVLEKTRGHFLMNGLPPYARMAFAGVFGMHAENSVSWVTTARSFADPIEKLALEGHHDMMQEKPPLDGHRRTILDPDATHVGVGYAVDHGRFQMAQEFLSRKLLRLSLSSEGRRRPAVVFEGRPAGQLLLQFVTVGWEPEPQPLSREEASGRSSYAYPEAKISYIPEGYHLMRVIGTTSEDRLKIRPDRSFSFDFQPARAGLYTFLFYIAAHPSSPPRPSGSAVLWFD